MISYYSLTSVSTGRRVLAGAGGSYPYKFNEVPLCIMHYCCYIMCQINVEAVAKNRACGVHVSHSSEFRFMHINSRGALTNVTFDTNGKEGYIVIAILNGERLIVRLKPRGKRTRASMPSMYL